MKNKKILKTEDLGKIREMNKGKTIGFCTGCFDILHAGHAVFFQQCKSLADILIVGVGSDSVIKELKGENRPINQEYNRIYLIASMQDVDFAVLGGEAKDMKPGKIDFYENIKGLKPDVFILNDNDSAIDEKRELCRELGIELKFVSRTVPDFLSGTSSTEIINKSKIR